MQASSDLSVLDFDIPHSITFVAAVAIEILVTICVMVFVTWPVLIVAIPAIVASKYVQVYSISKKFSFLFLVPAKLTKLIFSKSFFPRKRDIIKPRQGS